MAGYYRHFLFQFITEILRYLTILVFPLSYFSLLGGKVTLIKSGTAYPTFIVHESTPGVCAYSLSVTILYPKSLCTTSLYVGNVGKKVFQTVRRIFWKSQNPVLI